MFDRLKERFSLDMGIDLGTANTLVWVAAILDPASFWGKTLCIDEMADNGDLLGVCSFDNE